MKLETENSGGTLFMTSQEQLIQSESQEHVCICICSVSVNL